MYLVSSYSWLADLLHVQKSTKKWIMKNFTYIISVLTMPIHFPIFAHFSLVFFWLLIKGNIKIPLIKRGESRRREIQSLMMPPLLDNLSRINTCVVLRIAKHYMLVFRLIQRTIQLKIPLCGMVLYVIWIWPSSNLI